jgi:hypothetical protein
MPDQPMPPEPDRYQGEATVLDLLADSTNHRPWTLQELALEVGDPLTAADAVANLLATGLVHTTSDGLVFASRAAIRCREIAEL